MYIKRIKVLFIVALACINLYGCGAVLLGGAAAGATYVYTEGWVERDYNGDAESVYNASLDTVKSMGMMIEEQNLAVASGKIKARKGDKTYWLKIEERARNRTTLSIREGVVGNDEASRAIHENVEQRL